MSASLKAQIKSKIPLVVRLSKLFADPLRMKILAECNMREMSPKLFYEEFGGGSLPRVARAFDVLVEYDWLYLTKTKSGGKRRGGVEHFYRATEPAVLDEALWKELPKGARREYTTWRVLETFVQQVKEAMEAGTIELARTIISPGRPFASIRKAGKQWSAGFSRSSTSSSKSRREQTSAWPRPARSRSR